MPLSIPPILEEIAKAIHTHHGRTMLVGGAVRDQLLGLPLKDLDLEVYGLPLEKVEKIISSFGPVNSVGSSFAVLKLRYNDSYIDVALPRRDRKSGPGHTGFVVEADPGLTLAEAARRRDFTMNAIMLDPLTGEISDPYHGRQDLEKKVLRVVDPATFAEDPLRVVRAWQFAARFSLTIDPSTEALLRSMIPLLRELPPERMFGEWKKLFLLADRPSVGLQIAHRLGYFATYYPKVHQLSATPQAPSHHPEGDVWTHTLMVIDQAAKIIENLDWTEDDRLVVMLGALTHDFGKATTTKQVDDRFPAHGHEQAGVDFAKSFLSQQGFPHHVVAQVLPIIGEHMRPHALFFAERDGGKAKDGAIRRLVNRLHPATLEQLLAVVEADALGRGVMYNDQDQEVNVSPEPVKIWLRQRVASLDLQNGPVPVLQGRDLLLLDWKPSPLFGQIIAAAETLAEEKNLTRQEILALLLTTDSPQQALEKITAS